MASRAINRLRQAHGSQRRRTTLEELPPTGTFRWVPRRKAEVLAAIRNGLITEDEAIARWSLTPAELAEWQDSLDRAGVPGLRVTRIQVYRGYDQRVKA